LLQPYHSRLQDGKLPHTSKEGDGGTASEIWQLGWTCAAETRSVCAEGKTGEGGGTRKWSTFEEGDAEWDSWLTYDHAGRPV